VGNLSFSFINRFPSRKIIIERIKEDSFVQYFLSCNNNIQILNIIEFKSKKDFNDFNDGL